MRFKVIVICEGKSSLSVDGSSRGQNYRKTFYKGN